MPQNSLPHSSSSFFPFLLIVASSLPFFHSLHGDFVFDDGPAVIKNSDLDITSASNLSTRLASIFKHDFWGEDLLSSNSHKSYRPLTTITFLVQKILDPDSNSTFAYHITNVVLHSTNSLLTFHIFKLIIFPNSRSAFIASLIFALHPVHVESVAGIVGRADLLYSLIFLGGILLSLRRVSGLLFVTVQCLSVGLMSFASMLCKEVGIMLIPVVCLIEMTKTHKLRITRQGVKIFRPPKLLLKVVIYLTSFCFAIFFRMSIVDFTPPTFQRGDNPFAFLKSGFYRRINLSYLYSINAWILLSPDWLCFDWAFHCIAPIESWKDPRSLCSPILFSILASLVIVALKRTDYRLLISIGFLVFPFLPASNLILTVGFVIAERNLYLCVMGLAALVTLGFDRLGTHKFNSSVSHFFMFLLLAVFALKTCFRSSDWQSEPQLYTSGLRVCPNNPKVYYNLGKLAADASTQSGRPQTQLDRSKAKAFYHKALQLWPDYQHVLNNLGNLYRQEGNSLEAKRLFTRALEIQPHFPACWMNLGVAQANLGEHLEAESSYRIALEQRKPYPDCHYNLGTLYLKMRDFAKAVDQFQFAIRQRPNHFSAWSNLVILLDNLEKYEDAELGAKQALNIFPDKPEFYFHLGNILGKRERFPEAEEMYLVATKFDSGKSIYFVNLGVLYHRWKKYSRAAQAYNRALDIDPNNLSAKANLEKLNGLY